MAIDTRNRRASAMNPGCPWRGVMPAPDAAVGSADRATGLLLYAGILASSVAATVGHMEFRIPSSRLEFTLPGDRLAYSMPKLLLETNEGGP